MSLLKQVNMKIIFCEFLDSQNKDGTITIKPLGKAKNSVSKPTLHGWKDVVTDIVIDKTYTKGLDGIEDYSHVIVVYWMDKEKECHLKHHPQGRKDIPFVGIFACRCPQRPNRIAMSTVNLFPEKEITSKSKGLISLMARRLSILNLMLLTMTRSKMLASQIGLASLFFN